MAALVVVAVSVAVSAGMRGPAPVEPAVTVSSGPRFLLVADNDGVTVRDARTGKIIDRVGVPRTPEGSFRDPGGYLLAGTGEGAAFYVARSVTSRRTQVSTTRFHRVRVDGQGKVADLTHDVIPAVTGTAASSSPSPATAPGWPTASTARCAVRTKRCASAPGPGSRSSICSRGRHAPGRRTPQDRSSTSRGRPIAARSVS